MPCPACGASVFTNIMLIKHKEQRVGVFIDVQNLYYSAKNLYKAKVNFNEILKIAVGNRKLIRAFAYVIKTDELKEKTFFEALEKLNREVYALRQRNGMGIPVFRQVDPKERLSKALED